MTHRYIFQLVLYTIIQGLSGCANIYWRGDFESGSLNQWSHILNSQGVNLSSEHAAQGIYSAHLSVKGDRDYLWNDDPHLNRVELQYKPPALHTREGSDLFFGWNFMLPELLTESRHEFGYWESFGSWRQMMRFNLSGKSISFQTAIPARLHWQAEVLKPGIWHHIGMHIHWSVGPERGFVSVWFDGIQVLNRVAARTLFSEDEPMFVQLGLLRDRNSIEEEIYIDNAVEAACIEVILNDSKRSH